VYTFANAQLGTKSGDSPQWYRYGPEDIWVNTLAVAPSNNNIVYLGTIGMGVIKSNNKGEQWESCSLVGLPIWEDSLTVEHDFQNWLFGDQRPIEAIAVFPENSEHLFISSYERGIFESKDGGNFWIKTGVTLPDTLTYTKIVINPSDTNDIYACGGKHLISGGLFRTKDGGKTWNLVNQVPHGGSYQINGITYDPNDHNRWICSFVSSFSENPPAGLMETLDNGTTWNLLKNGEIYKDITIDQLDSKIVWGVQLNGWGDYNLVKSENGGVDFSIIQTPTQQWCNNLFIDNNQNMFITQEVPYSLLRIENNMENSKVLDTVFLPYVNGTRNAIYAKDDEVFWGAENGFRYSNDKGNNFEIRHNGMTNAFIMELALSSKDYRHIYAGSWQGFYESRDAGTSWNRLCDEPTMAIAIDPNCPDTLYFDGGWLYRSYDGGNTYTKIYDGLFGDVCSLVIDPIQTNHLYCVTGVDGEFLLYKSIDKGDSWVFIHAFIQEDNNYELLVDTKLPNTIYCGRYKSTDAGQIWSEMDKCIAAIHPQNSDILFGFLEDEVSKSVDGGLSWEVLDRYDGYPPNRNHMLHQLFLDPKNPENLYYTTANHGVRFSLNGGMSWSWLEGTYEKRNNRIIAIPERNTYYVGTYGDGLWVYGIPVGINDDKLDTNRDIIEVFPNPFNEQINIILPEFCDKESRLHIYNNLGQLINNYTIVSGNKDFCWNGSDSNGRSCAPGIYYVEFVQNDRQSVKQKIIKIK
jgi:photosystem II stability/assembly factor-like uncharacterized protein